MKPPQWCVLFLCLMCLENKTQAATDHVVPTGNAASAGSSNASSAPSAPASASAVTEVVRPEIHDPCLTPDVAAAPSRPNWSAGAATTQCGVIEVDSGWLRQPMGRGVYQQLFASSLRYGLTPKLDLRWGMTHHVVQSGGNQPAVEGSGDQSASLTYRFKEQGRWAPAMAFSFGINIPAANPEKGFGSGFYDHQFVFIASRDLGNNHFDFNVAGTLTGEQRSHDGAAQFGLALTRPITRKLSWVFENYGGAQPETSDRLGAVLNGVSYAFLPRLVFDGAYVRTYTGGAPRQQVLCGFTYAMRPFFPTLQRQSAIARLLGR